MASKQKAAEKAIHADLPFASLINLIDQKAVKIKNILDTMRNTICI
jgi:hypothetical protein